MRRSRVANRIALVLRWVVGVFYALIGANGVFHCTLLERQPFTSGPFVVGTELFLAWYFWDSFRPLWNAGASLPLAGSSDAL